jgi:hypothetical protein
VEYKKNLPITPRRLKKSPKQGDFELIWRHLRKNAAEKMTIL